MELEKAKQITEAVIQGYQKIELPCLESVVNAFPTRTGFVPGFYNHKGVALNMQQTYAQAHMEFYKAMDIVLRRTQLQLQDFSLFEGLPNAHFYGAINDVRKDTTFWHDSNFPRERCLYLDNLPDTIDTAMDTLHKWDAMGLNKFEEDEGVFKQYLLLVRNLAETGAKYLNWISKQKDKLEKSPHFLRIKPQDVRVGEYVQGTVVRELEKGRKEYYWEIIGGKVVKNRKKVIARGKTKFPREITLDVTEARFDENARVSFAVNEDYPFWRLVKV